MSSFTCISCRVAFADGEVQRAHYKTDWHRYNLKRKVADMVPVTADDFQERVLAQRAAADRLLSAAADAGESCSACSKRFSSSNAFQNHLRSHKHRQEEKRALLAVRQKEDHMNRKNQEKGLGEEEGEKEGEEEEEEEEEKEKEGTPVDHDSHNEALRLALREQQKADPARGEEGEARGGGAAKRPRAEKPPRLVWLEEQARRGGEPEAPEAQEAQDDDWEDVDGEEEDDDEMDDDEMDDDDDDEEEAMVQEEGGAVPPVTSDPQVVLPGSLPVTDCLFCPHRSRSLLRNVAHMTRHHGFFLPDPEFLVDLRGLVRYLGEKVGAGNVCLWCNERGRSFYSTAAVQGHMTDKSHCKLLTDGDAALEFADFYDFRSSYPDQKEGEDGDLDSLPDDKDMLYDDDSPLELTLPSGARIGHRSLMRYYKQRFGAQRAVVLAHNQNAVGRVLRHYRALGWSADRGKSGFHTNARDMPYVQKLKSRWMLKVGMTNNKCKQHYFRAQVMF